MNPIFISNISCWAPSLYDDDSNWELWASEQTEIPCLKESPKLEFTDPLFRRRLSQISKMTIQVTHELFENTYINRDTKLVFISLRGEIEREFSINEGIIEDNAILPASFSLSVFNTPIAITTLALKLKGGYSVIYPSKNDFSHALKAAIAPVLAETEKQIILIYADELIPDVYKENHSSKNEPFAFAALISSKEAVNSIKLDDINNICTEPSAFLKKLLKIKYNLK